MIVGDQREVIAFLERPSSYGPGVGRIERIDTHGAIVFLAGSHAYKLKRAVRFPYMDFSTLERRHQVAEAEVTVNRRTAPSLYEGVLPVTRGPGGLALGGSGEVVEWLVVMRRFEQDSLFDRMASDGRLTAELILDLAWRVAAFHRAAEQRPEFGGVGGIAWVLDVNRKGFAEAAAMLDPEAARTLDRRCVGELDRHADLLEARRASGRVRHCHGDLHLRNICLVDGAPTLFDAIEFNDEIANIDTLYDAAFLFMDLCRYGLGDLANLAFNRYLEASGDYGGLPAIPLFLACRAAIRAHTLAATAASQPAGEDRRRLSTEAQASLVLAGRFFQAPRARVIAIGGLSGAGKSTIARAVAPALDSPPGAIVLRTDVIRKSLAGVAPNVRLPPSAYTPEADVAVYRDLIDRARVVARAGRTVILDAVFARPEQRAVARVVAGDAGIPFTGLWLQAREEVMMERVEGRRGDASDARSEIVRLQLGYDIGQVEWPVVETGGAIATTLAAVRSRLI